MSNGNACPHSRCPAHVHLHLPRCQRVAEGLECGIVWVNCSQPCFSQAPWGGVKNSGHGCVCLARVKG